MCLQHLQQVLLFLYDSEHAVPAANPQILLGSGRSHLGVAPLAPRSCARPGRAVADTGLEAKPRLWQEGLLAASSNSSPIGARLPPQPQGQASEEAAEGQHDPPKGLPAVSSSRSAVEACSQPQKREQAASNRPPAGQAGPGAAEQHHVHQQVLAESSGSRRQRASSQHQEPVPLRSPVTGRAAPGDTVPDTPVSSRAGSLPRGSGGSQGPLPTQDGVMWALPSLASQPGRVSQPGGAAQAGNAQPAAQPAASCQKPATGVSSGGRQASEQAVQAPASAAAEAPAQGLYADGSAAVLAPAASPAAQQLQGVPAATSIVAPAAAQAAARLPPPGQGRQQQEQETAAALPLPAAGSRSSGSGALCQTLLGMDAAAAMSPTPAACPRAGPWPQQQAAGAALGLGKRKQPEVASAEAGIYSRTDSSSAAEDSFRQGRGKGAVVRPQQQQIPAPAAGSPVAAVRPAQPVTPTCKSLDPAKAGRGASKPSRLQSSSGGQSEGEHLQPQQQAVLRGQAAPTDARTQQGKADFSSLATGALGQLQRLHAGTAGWGAGADAQAQRQQATFSSPAGAAQQQRRQASTSDLAAGTTSGPQLPQAGCCSQAAEAAAAPQLPQVGPRKQTSEPWSGRMSMAALPRWMATSGDEAPYETPAELLQVAAGAATRHALPAPVEPPTEFGEPPSLVENPVGAAPARSWQQGAAGTASAEAAAPLWPHQQGRGSPSGRGSAAPAAAAQAPAGQQSSASASSPAGPMRGFLSRPDPNPHGLRPGRASLLGMEGPVAAQAAAGGAGVALAGALGPSTAPVAVNGWALVQRSWAASSCSGVWVQLIQLPQLATCLMCVGCRMP